MSEKHLGLRSALQVSLLSVIVLLSSCREMGHRDAFVFETRQLLEPAADAAEFLQRVDRDLTATSISSEFLPILYAELPPKDHWPAVIEALPKHIENAKDETKALKLSLFLNLLRQDKAASEKLVREIVTADKISEWQRPNAIYVLLGTSTDIPASLEWIRENSPDLLVPRESSTSLNLEPLSGWEKAFAENQIEEGIEQLLAELEKTQKPSDKADLYGTMARLGKVLERQSLIAVGSMGLLDSFYADIKGGNHLSTYPYSNIFDGAAHMKKWDYIISEFEAIHTAIQAVRGKEGSELLRENKNIYAIYLTALLKTEAFEKFTGEIEQAKIDWEKKSHNNFYDLLATDIPNHPPLGIHYLDFLKKKEKAPVLDYALHLLARNPGKDVFYEYLIALDEEKAKPFITDLHAYDPFEERPLIWLAEIARRNGDLKTAEETINRAIALDPSDGDHGKDTRMFCYEILARIYSDMGEKEKAAKYRTIVDSIRQGEAADDFLHVGLIKEATARYEKALKQFSDAYCLQSRLALTLAKHGKFKQAAVHFEKAFQLMPVSFGPRESHCFGCQGLFDDPRVIAIAQPLLEEFQRKNPDNPRAPYLLGLILSEKGEQDQAALAYQKALELDPAYYNAATKLLAIMEADPAKHRETEELKSQIFEIAPYALKPSYLPNTADLHAYWNETLEFPPSPLDLPENPAIAAIPRDEVRKEQYIEGDDVRYFYFSLDSESALDGWSPSELRLNNSFLSAIEDID